MCGITGIFGLEGIENPQQRVGEMTQALAHRGPDAEGFFLAENVALGHRRLSIIDLQEASNQPFFSPDKRYVLVYNGELYNYEELKQELSSEHSFQTESDTEVVLKAFMSWGVKCLQKFNGMFAFALWDQQLEKLWLVRDRLGIKPLYYSHKGSNLVFASEVRALLASSLVERTLDQASIQDFLTYQTVHAPKTIVKDVFMLPPATYLEVTDNEVVQKEYWKPWHSVDSMPLVNVKGQIKELLTHSVDIRMKADVPFGAFLSGGIDSSLIVGIIREYLGKSIDTFNVSFGDSEFSEAKYALEVANKFGSNHHEILLQPTDFLESLPEALQAIDHPSGDGPNTWVVSRATKKEGISMALSGLGGDELFAGYDVFKRIPYISEKNWILSFPKGIRTAIGGALSLAKPGIQSKKTTEILEADYFDLEHLYPIFRKVLLDSEVKRIYKSHGYQNRVTAILQDLEQYPDFSKLPVLSRISIAEMSTYMQNVLLRDSDQMSMAHALELRVPFLDHRLVELATQISDQDKYPTTPKRLLIESFPDLLPNSIVNRPKMGFVLPWEHWLKNDLRKMAVENIELLGSSESFHATALHDLWKRFEKGDPSVTWSRVWPLIVLADWMKRNGFD